jgi:transposase
MMGIKIRNFAPLPNLSLEELVPEDNFYRRLGVMLDLSFVRELVRDCYASGGRPSIDPVVFFRLQLVMFFEDIRSERRLMEVAADRLSIRWFLGYDLDEPLPDHSSLTRIRERYGLECSGASSSGSCRSAWRWGWCGARSFTSTPQRLRPTRT